jgi:hypothetical protein
VLNAPDDAVNGELPPPFIDIVGPKLVIWFLVEGVRTTLERPETAPQGK